MMFLTKGVAKHKEKLASFELALRDAGIAQMNLVNVSSIFPPGCKLLSRQQGLKHLKPARWQHSECESTNEPTG
jgi:arginine decarboxylase